MQHLRFKRKPFLLLLSQLEVNKAHAVQLVARRMPFRSDSVIDCESDNRITDFSASVIIFTLLNYSAYSATAHELESSKQRGTYGGGLAQYGAANILHKDPSGL